ncbi:hypothetical protein CDES_12165 [Corynebacterium deserti GIMN1.010]|uniref:CGL2689-like C-terminal domain-containing protein n=1 Tax=Corynebacterium deserti GIMN1.010 TaxID=931089 RepID=A0A0M3QA67_9CORY|nr:hypothetical protein [Corynebacterium deserti]ALC06783.1 hypothetical protein CDES_12165 [Corynebacterium deserti GIMN1.010]
MQAPRLRIGIVTGQGGASTGLSIADALEAVGHHVQRVEEYREITEFELIVIDAPDVASIATELSAFSRRGQMFLHTSLVHDITVMDPLETSGAIVMSAHPIGQDRWVASAVDELGETIVGLLVGEMGGTIIDVPDARRAQLAAALTYAGFMATLQRDAMYFLDELLGDIAISSDIVDAAAHDFQPLPELSAITAQYDAIDHPGRQRLFRDLARRQAEISRAQDIELWAIQKEDR